MMLAGLVFFATPVVHAATVLPVYLDGANAPAPLVSRVDDRLHAILSERSIAIATIPDAPTAPEARIASAKKELEKGIAAYRALQLDTALPALTAAEKDALGVPESPEAPKVLADARIYLGIMAAATGTQTEADRLFRMVAATDPDRRLDSKQFPPDTVAAYEKSRKAVAAASFGDVALSASAEGVAFLADGKPISGANAHLSFGEHLLLASGEAGTAADRFEVTESKSAWRANIAPDPRGLLTALRAAAKRGDEAAILKTADALAAASGAGRVLLWDLRSTSGRVEAPLRFHDLGARSLSRASIADLGAGTSPDPALRTALASLLAPETAPLLATKIPEPRRARPARKGGVGNWVWWTAGGIALLAAGGAAAALSQPPPGGEKVAVSVQH